MMPLSQDSRFRGNDINLGGNDDNVLSHPRPFSVIPFYFVSSRGLTAGPSISSALRAIQ